MTTSCSTPASVSAAVEGGVVLGGDVLVVAGLEREDRGGDLARALGRARLPVALAGHAVEADGARQAVPGRGGEPGVAAAEAEADREDRLATLVAQIGDRGARRRPGLPSGVVWATCSMYGNSSSRFATPAVRPK